MGIFCWHKWGKWGEAVNAYSQVSQHSKCEKCGSIRYRKIGVSIYCSEPILINKAINKIEDKLNNPIKEQQ